jgi:predicted DNA-binding protein
MSATSDESKADRLTLRLPGRDLERLRELARQRKAEVAALAREAIRAYLDGQDPHAAQAQLAHELREAVREQADRVIDRHEQVTRALIAALNQHLKGKSP